MTDRQTERESESQTYGFGGKSVRGERSHISVRTYPYGYREEEFNMKTLKKLVIATVFRFLFYVVLYAVLCKMLHLFIYFNYIKYS